MNETANSSKGHLLGGILLIAGTTIGGGMLGLPVLTSLTGFVPASLAYVLCWLCMVATGLLYLEVSLWLKKQEGANLISMAEATLGKPGKYLAWGVYLFLFYCLTLAYTVGCGALLVEWSGNLIPPWAGSLLFLLLFSPFVVFGPKAVHPINIFMMIGLAISYCIFVFLGFPFVNSSLLARQDWSFTFMALPIAFLSFGYQGTIPTLVHYMKFDIKKMRLSIWIGSFIPLLAYIIWEWLILGIVPLEGENGLLDALAQGKNAVSPLRFFLNRSEVYLVGQFFAFFALVTSFFGVTLGLLDFLADGLKIRKNVKGKVLLGLLVFFPPFLIGTIYPDIFLKALDYAGGYGGSFLLGLLPVLMVWRGRYVLGWSAPYSLRGGRPLLIAIASFVLLVILSTLIN